MAVRSEAARALIAAIVSGLVSSAAFAGSVTVVVTSTADVVTGCSTTGVPAVGTAGCTLRDAILYSDANPPTAPAQNLIQFNLPGSGVQTIELGSALPDVTTATIIDGYSQPGASPNTLAVGSDAVRLVSVHASFSLFLGHVLKVSGASGSVIRGLVLLNENTGPSAITVFLDSCCNNSVVGNVIGLDATGTQAIGATVAVETTSRNQIGGPSPADRNVVAGYPAVQLDGSGNTVEGNYLGIDATGSTATGTQSVGVSVLGDGNLIRGNVVSGNGFGGVWLAGSSNVVTGNLIGTDASGTGPVPNLIGVDLTSPLPSNNTIGSSSSLSPILRFLFEGNTIAFNSEEGVRIETTSPSEFPLAQSVLSNSIVSNGALGINLCFAVTTCDGVTPNDAGDADDGPNHLQNFPVLTSASGITLKTKVQGTLNSVAKTTYRVQLFSSSACDSSGFGEGETLVDEIFVTTNGSGNASINDSIFPRIPPGQYVTATATDPSGNTSEFSQCVPVTPFGPPPPPPYPTVVRFLEDGPIHVPPGVPVEFPFGVEAKPEARRAATGQVTLTDDAGHRCQASLIRSGVGACALTFPGAGTYRVVAHYAANGDFLASDSEALTVVVDAPGD